MAHIQYKVDIIYPKTAQSYFDWPHYLAVHSPLALSTAIKFAKIERYDVAQPIDEGSAPHHCVSTLFFNTQEEMYKLLDAYASPEFEAAAADLANFTNVTPMMVPGIHHEWDGQAQRVR